MPADNPFAERPEAYAAYRPGYPDALFAWMASRCRHTTAAWDCATGNGQAARGLSAHFDRVVATDISPEQLAHAPSLPGVSWSVRSAEESGLPDATFDLVAVGQALHWFDFPRFWPEVSRVCRPGALFCAWSYAWPVLDPVLEEALVDPARRILEPFWAPENAVAVAGYPVGDIGFPFEVLPTPELAIQVSWSLERLIRYLHTWSGWQRATRDPRAADALGALERRARGLVAADGVLAVRMPLAIRAGRVHP